jgi:drug/metabolite transporter (DMT)-like permease
MWVLIGFFLAADWALVIVINKRLLSFVHPLPLNFLLRIVAIVGLVCATVPLTVFGWWDLGFGLTPTAAGYIAVSAIVTWVVAFNAYYYALRAGRASIVAPVTATDPIWAALFAPLLLGAALDPLVIVGLLVATVGVVLIARWMSEEPGQLLETTSIPVAAAPAVARAGPGDGGAGGLGVVALALIAAAGWGLGPVVIELAENANGGASAGMMLGSQALGAVLLGAILLVRRGPILVRPLAAERRRFILLLLASGVLEVVFGIFYYLMIEAIGAVLTLLITATSPVFAILGGAILLKEPVGKRLWAAVALTIGGVVIATLARVV